MFGSSVFLLLAVVLWWGCFVVGGGLVVSLVFFFVGSLVVSVGFFLLFLLLNFLGWGRLLVVVRCLFRGGVSFCRSGSWFVPVLFVFVSLRYCMVLMVNGWLTVVDRCSVGGVACCWRPRCVAFCFCFCMGTFRA